MRRRLIGNSIWFAPGVLALVSLLTFGLLLPWLGFYWDDWAKILVGRLFGLSHYFAYYAEDRPLSAWTHIVFTPLLGNRSLVWQIFELGLRWLSAWVFFASLEQIWPSARRQNLSAALIFLVYPAFIQQPAAVTFFQQWLQYSLYFFSLYAMLKSVRAGARQAQAWALAALIAMLFQLSVTEYFVPVELVRPLVLWLLLVNTTPMQPKRIRVMRVLKVWGLYLAVLTGYTLWRLFFIHLPGADPYEATTLSDLLRNPIPTLQHLVEVVRIDFAHILLGSWVNLVQGNQFTELKPFFVLSIIVGLTGALLAGFALMRTPEPDEDSRTRWTRQALVFGLAAALLGPIPAWITGRQVVFDFHSDRYALPAMFGASLVWIAAIEWVAQKRLQRAALLGLLLTFAISLQLQSANDYRWNWTAQQRFYWQLAWRVPSLKPSTALFFQTEPFENQGLFSTSAAINLLYPQAENMPVDPQTGERQLSYWVYTLSPRYGKAPESFDTDIGTQFRTLKFTGNMRDSLLLYNDRNISDCLWVLSSRDAENPRLPNLVKDFLPISDLDRILPQQTDGFPAEDLFGPEPEHTTWCYYFEKADLARQFQDWEEVIRLGDEAQANGYHPNKSGSNSPYEWLPFIEGYASLGQWDQAVKLTTAALQQDHQYASMLCDLWETGSDAWIGAGESKNEGLLQVVESTLGCQALVQK